MDQTLVIYTEQGTTKPSQSVEEELVLPRLRVQFQDETSSEVRLHVKSGKKIFQNVFTMSASFRVISILDRRAGLFYGH